MSAAKIETPDANWPLAQYSRRVQCGSLCWHVQVLGAGPVVVLIHGTGASTHSWRDVAINLSRDYQVVMFDLPGHGFTTGATRNQMSLPGMSQSIATLLEALALQPRYLVGHSAGAALSCQLVLDHLSEVERMVSINGALKPFDGMPGQLFAPLAKALSTTTLIPSLVSWRAANSDRLATRLLDDTGSRLNREGVTFYGQLLRRKTHVAGALSMMAHWDLRPLWQRLPGLETPLLLLVASQDQTVLPRHGSTANRRIASASFRWLPELGHLAHEENPDLTCRELRRFFEAGVPNTLSSTSTSESAGVSL